MQKQPRTSLLKAVERYRALTTSVIERTDRALPYIRSERPEFWDMYVLATSFDHSFRFAYPSLEWNLPWSGVFCSALVDEGVYARGLLFPMLYLAVEAGLVSNLDDLQQLGERLSEPNNQQAQSIIVAYLDYVGATANGYGWQHFSEIGRLFTELAHEQDLGTYFWRSSDSYYFFRVIDGQADEAVRAECVAFLKVLIDLQGRYSVNDVWSWQIGVDLTKKSTAIGDIFLPGVGESEHARLMSMAKDGIRGGGLILVTKEVKEQLGALGELFKRLRGDSENTFYYERLTR